jgi:hypothetical protein
MTLNEEYRLKVFENWMLRRIFGPQRDNIIGCNRTQHKEGAL